jgi:phosphoglycerate dehydrogenase-like enzyme
LLVADNYVRSLAATKRSPTMRPQQGMRGRRVGVYGMGEIGRKIAARAAAFEAEVGYCSRTRRNVYAKEPHAPDALTALPNVVLSPHIGGHTLESHGDAGLRHRQPRGVFRGPTAGLCGAVRLTPQCVAASCKCR